MKPDKRLSVIVCDDHPIFRGGVVAAISEEDRVVVVAEASDGEGCIAKLEIYQPDVLITDLSMPGVDGFQLLEWASKNQPALRTYILSMYSELSYVVRARELGACGFLAKEDAQSELLSAMFGNPTGFFTSESVGTRPSDPNLLAKDHGFAQMMKTISPAELRVLKHLTHSMTNKEIAEQLHISVRTVEAHRARLAEKLDAKGPNKLLELAIRFKTEITEQQ